MYEHAVKGRDSRIDQGAAQNGARDQTELENMISTLRNSIAQTIEGIQQIARRVIPPVPTKEPEKVAPIAMTYHDHMRDLINGADIVRNIVNELVGRI